MSVEVSYEGLVLAQNAKMYVTATGTFIEMAAPMPVGTQLRITDDDSRCMVRVTRVQEGSSAGAYVVTLDARTQTEPSPSSQLDPTPAPTIAAAAPPPPSEPAEVVDTGHSRMPPAGAEASAAPLAITDGDATTVMPAPPEASGIVDDEMPPTDTEPMLAPPAPPAAAASGSADDKKRSSRRGRSRKGR